MLIALIVGMLLGGGSSGIMAYVADARADVKTVVEDKTRRGEALAILKRMKKRAGALHKQAGKSGKALNKALKSRAVPDADVEAIWSAHFERVDQFNADMIDLRFELREQLTREEWRQLFDE
jgi:thioredoxin reductase